MDKKSFVLFLLLFLLPACQPATTMTATPTVEFSDLPTLVFTTDTPEPTYPAETPTLEATSPPEPAETPMDEETIIWMLADAAITALQQRDMDKLADLVHPSFGLRFSAYGYIQPTSLVFSADQVRGFLDDDTVYVWGAFDGTGDPIEMDFVAYYNRFIYPVDFVNAPQTSYNQQLGHGNTINNILDAFPNPRVIEYHFPEFDPQYGGMDWRSMRLVFQEYEGKWYLAGIVHDQWTI